MADAPEAGASSSGTNIEDVRAEDFVLSDFVQEIATLIWEREAVLDSKQKRKTISKEDENLAKFRLIRMGALHHYLKRIEARQAGKPIEETAPAPKFESPLKDFVQEIEAEADRETGRVEEFEQHQDELVQPEPEALPSKAPAVEEKPRHDDWD